VTVRWRAVPEADWGAVYSCGGNVSLEDVSQDANNEFSVQFDTTADPVNCTNGPHDLEAWAFGPDGPIGTPPNHRIDVTIQNDPQPPPPPPGACDGAVPSPIVGQGYTQRFGDCFNTLDRSTWCQRLWWEPSPSVGSQAVVNGELRLRRARTADYQNTTVSTEPCGQANPKSFQYGYFETRMRYETVRGNGPAFWLFSTRHATNPDWPALHPDCTPPAPDLPDAECYAGEIDVFEGYGRVNGGFPDDPVNDVHTCSLHRNSSGPYGVSNTLRQPSWQRTGLDLSQPHVYGLLWTPTEIRCYLDGQLMGTSPTFDSTKQPMYLILSNWNTGWVPENMPNASTEPDLDVFVDWVRAWQRP
jgi:Glycosyl hydrolases family 16